MPDFHQVHIAIGTPENHAKTDGTTPVPATLKARIPTISHDQLQDLFRQRGSHGMGRDNTTAQCCVTVQQSHDLDIHCTNQHMFVQLPRHLHIVNSPRWRRQYRAQTLELIIYRRPDRQGLLVCHARQSFIQSSYGKLLPVQTLLAQSFQLEHIRCTHDMGIH